MQRARIAREPVGESGCVPVRSPCAPRRWLASSSRMLEPLTASPM